jgi:20S proteasome subunit beta 3
MSPSYDRRRRSTSWRWLRLSLASALPIALTQNPMTLNGGSILAMAGKNCVAVAVDKRFGRGQSLVAVRNRPVLYFSDATLVAFTGFERDVQSLSLELTAQVARKYNRGLGFAGIGRRQNIGRASDVSVKAVAFLTSHILYQRKSAPYYVETLVVGLQPEEGFSLDGTCNDDNITAEQAEGDTAAASTIRQMEESTDTLELLIPRKRYKPYLCSMDVLGAMSTSPAFVCAGTAEQSLYGTAEALWKPNLTPDELLAVCSQAFLSALERDAMSGYGAVVYILTPDGITEYDLLGRSD